MQPFTIAAFTFGTKNGTVPEIGTYKIIGFSVANELSIGIDLSDTQRYAAHIIKNDTILSD